VDQGCQKEAKACGYPIGRATSRRRHAASVIATAAMSNTCRRWGPASNGMSSLKFALGVADVRAGRSFPANYDDWGKGDDVWGYERGRMWARLTPRRAAHFPLEFDAPPGTQIGRSTRRLFCVGSHRLRIIKPYPSMGSNSNRRPLESDEPPGFDRRQYRADILQRLQQRLETRGNDLLHSAEVGPRAANEFENKTAAAPGLERSAG
jgi:hypothetical protein